ncbi:MAG: exodeoxyribonuclease VII large subunit [Clostridia bacterium]|nr:exodeoxyribonuclease VII large subunit [Clostridia bacterium]
MNINTVTVSQLNLYIKTRFEMDENLSKIFVMGEVSNFKRHYPSGHVYFSLKDERSVVRAVMFSQYSSRIPFNICDGMKVVVCGRVSCYEVSGQYQIYVENIQPDGLGSVYMAFEQLKIKLQAEGLFDEALKKPLPQYPKKIGVITSETGAVIHDIKTVAKKRYPICEIVLYPVEVQGEKAGLKIAEGINYFNKEKDPVDVMIVGRGGGSVEDLWPFNSEEVARAIFSSKIPVISAVGHETDFTICDFVADKRAATPSAAAQMATPDKENLKIIFEKYQKDMQTALEFKIEKLKDVYAGLIEDLKRFSPKRIVEDYKIDLEDALKDLNVAFKMNFGRLNEKYKLLCSKLQLCSPQNVLKKGYSVILLNEKRVKSVKKLKNNKRVKIVFSDGTAECTLSDIKKL